MIAVYVRVSKLRKDEQNLKAQQDELKAWAKGKKGITFYQDTFTGKTMDRPGFNRLMQDVATGKVSAIVVWRLDRLGRTAKGLTALFEDLVQRKVNLISLRDGINLDTPAGKLIAHVLASVAQYETEVRAERIMLGLNRKRERVKAGKESWNNGRPKGSGHKLLAPVVKQIKRMRAEKLPVATIARMLKVSRPTVYAALAKK